MKKSRFVILALTFLFLFPRSGHSINPAIQKGYVCSRDSSSTNIPTTYTTGAGVATCTITGRSHAKIINKSTTDIAVSYSTATNCVGGTDSDIVLGSSTGVSDNVGVNSIVCLRSLGSTISTGKVYLVFW